MLTRVIGFITVGLQSSHSYHCLQKNLICYKDYESDLRNLFLLVWGVELAGLCVVSYYHCNIHSFSMIKLKVSTENLIIIYNCI